MMRNFKVLGLAFVAILAMGAMGATAAQASDTAKFTAEDYPAILDATGTEFERFTAFGAEVTCKHADFAAELTEASDELTVEPTYSDCHALGFEEVGVTSTVTTNGCDYRFHSPKTDGLSDETKDGDTHHFYNITVDVVCPKDKVIEVHIYAAGVAHSSLNNICTLTVDSQEDLEGLTVDVHTRANGKNDATITGTVNDIHVTQHRNSEVCPAGETTDEATYHVPTSGVTAQGTKNEKLIDAHIG